MEEMKKRAAEHAVERIASGMKLGLGTGSTVRYVLDALGERLANGSLTSIVGVPTSEATRIAAEERKIPLTTLEECPHLDLTIDGADEVTHTLNSRSLDLIKGLGGALLREKIVAQASESFIVVADMSKQVSYLGQRVPLPIEVLPFGWSTHLPMLKSLGARANRRMNADGTPFITDNGNYILDCTFKKGIRDPHKLAAHLEQRPGILGHGLFLGMARTVFIGTRHRVVTLGAFQ